MTLPIRDRRHFLRDLGLGAATLPFVGGLSSLHGANREDDNAPQRLIVFFSPNGTLPAEFWPQQLGDEHELVLGSMLEPLKPFRDQILMLKGVHNRVGGDGDHHMRGMSCLLTATELHPGNIQGGGHTPAGWASGISIDQEIKNFYQAQPEHRTRFGSLEFGVAVPNRADPWTRMCYAGSNKPVAPIDNPAQMFEKIYGDGKAKQQLASVLDLVHDDLRKITRKLSPEDLTLVEQHMQQVQQLERDIAAAAQQQELSHPEPEIDPEIEIVNDNTPEISRMQIDLLISALANDMARVVSLQFMRSVGQARMRWLEVEEGHHALSHEPGQNADAMEKLKRINHWFAGELAYLAGRLAEIPEPGGLGGTMLDHTQIVWVNELGEGRTHTLNNIPLLLLGGGAKFKTGRALDLGGVPHNRLWLSLANALGHRELTTFGNQQLCAGGPLQLA
ncbi:MAG: DUF1552 domain-containing protein [Planctomycetota bacterium]